MLKSTVILVSLMLFFSLGCKNRDAESHINRAFYYWKSIFNPTHYEKQRLDSLDVNIIYIKLFDVIWSNSSKEPQPVAKLLVKDSAWLSKKQVIPTIFITNESFYSLDSLAILVLAKNVSDLANKLAVQNGFSDYKELQIDCDWSKTTKQKYFQLLETIKSLNPGKTISATIRLHQIKYKQSSGIPPVDKGLLMCYNMGDLQNAATVNSIIDEATIAPYIHNLQSYPLHLDVGLPLFSWIAIFDNNRFTGLIRNAPETLDGLTALKKTGIGYRVLKDTTIGGRPLKPGQWLRPEASDFHIIEKVGKELAKKINTSVLNLALYHLDSITLKKFSEHELESIYNSLR